MSVFVKTLSDIVALVLQALRLSVLLPAAVFVGLNAVFVFPQFKDTLLLQALQSNETEYPATILLLMAVLIVAYALAVLNIPIIRLFEGYPWALRFPGNYFRRAHLRRAAALQSAIDFYDMEARAKRREAKQETDATRHQMALEAAEDLALRGNLAKAQLAWFYPQHNPWRTLPTRLGNVIASAEEFPGHLYGLDAVTFWPFLSPILSKEGYAPFVERERAAFDFLLNMAVLTLVFGAELIYADLLLAQATWLSVAAKLGGAAIVAFAFYMVSIQGALSWGYTIRTAFVLYRDKLRERLGLIKPEGFYEERVLWQKATRFYHDQDVSSGKHIFAYPVPEEPDISGTFNLKRQEHEAES